MGSSAYRRLLRDLNVLGALVDDDRPSADERLLAMGGDEWLQALQSQLAAECRRGPRRRLRFERAAARLARLKQWQSSLVLVSLGFAVAVSMMFFIDVIWHLRSLLSGLGAALLVGALSLKARHQRVEEPWIGS
jgi:hypothetical protein